MLQNLLGKSAVAPADDQHILRLAMGESGTCAIIS
jgi:hypothetical protein